MLNKCSVNFALTQLHMSVIKYNLNSYVETWLLYSIANHCHC